MSAFFHGVMLLAAVVLLPSVMNLVPLSVLAAVLLHVGYKLASVALFRRMAKQKIDQWLPFGVTVVATVFTDLLIGVGIGMVVGLLFILKKNLDTAYYLHHLEAHEDEAHRLHVRLELGENVSFLNKASVSKVLHELPHQAVVEIDGTSSTYIDADVVEIIHEFVETANLRSIDVSLRGVPRAKNVVSVH